MTEPVRSPHLLEEHARQLATELRTRREPGRARRFRKRVSSLRAELRTAVERLARRPDPATAIAAEWLLDNEYLVLRAVDQVSRDLPADFFRRLPKVDPQGSGETRVEVLARASLEVTEGFIDVPRLERFIRAFQSVTALDIGELWAFPAFLRLVVAEEVVATVQRPTQADLVARINEKVAAAVGSLRSLESTDWRNFFESVSIVDRYLTLDPHKEYVRMDFDTRDRYRQAVEELARWSQASEPTVAKEALSAVREGDQSLGSFLIGPERRTFERRLACRPPSGRRIARVLRRYAGIWYFGAGAAATLGATALLLLPAVSAYDALTSAQVVVALALAFAPATSIAIAVCNEVATRVSRPRRLPRLDLSSGIPEDGRTVAAVPALLSDVDEVEALLRQIELNYRGNASRNLSFVLIADPVDAERPHLPEDGALLDHAASGIRDLNERHGSDANHPAFLLLTRDRQWNPAEGRWMAWERKRGKLHELNELLMTGRSSSLRVVEGDPRTLEEVRYVLVLDADTFLPEGAAARLVGTAMHPLNVPQFDAQGRVREGYTVLQPRVETLADSIRPTWFSKIFQASEGFDLYSHASSDVYQDLFGEGVFAGKGLYGVRAFERSVADRVPENTLLSHDLFEGVHGRTALVSDVTVIESYPAHPMAYLRRLHRWVRGDWQIARWLLPWVPGATGIRLRNRLSLLDRWKIFDNLRRSLLSVSLVLLTVLGWWWLPGNAWWSLLPLVVLGVPVLLPELVAAAGRWRSPWRETVFRTSIDRIGWASARWLAGVVLLPWQAWVETDAILRTLYRTLLSRRHLLEWTSAAATARSLVEGTRLGNRIRESFPAWFVPLSIAVAGALFGGLSWTAQGPLLAVWLSAPVLVWGLSREMPARTAQLDDAAIRRLRRLARRTWAYFDHLVSGEDHWLPPDNLQLHPVSAVARRTSPTNIGLGMLAQVVGGDLGYVPPSSLVATLASTLDTLDRLERHRGHLLNWYDTRNLRPLAPRYVSSVDSGNLAACAITIREGLHDLTLTRLPGVHHADGVVDGLEIVAETLEAFRAVPAFRPQELPATLRRIAEEIGDARLDGGLFAERLHALVQVGLPTMEAEVVDILEARRPPGGGSLGPVREWVRGLDRQATALDREIELLAPWLSMLREPPESLARATDPAVERAWMAFADEAPEAPILRDIPAVCRTLTTRLVALETAATTGRPSEGLAETRLWTTGLAARLDAAQRAAETLLSDVASVQSRLATLVEQMDFTFLYDWSRRLMRVGYHVDAATLDRSYYDLYASESRIASFVAIAKGDVPAEHWQQLGRPFARREGTIVLLSWAGTMFEYLMPALFFRTPPGSLADVACRRAVELQIRYGRRQRVPWGVSESGFHQTDPHNFYRYRAFGVGALGVRWDPEDRIVAAPYASVLALPYAPAKTLRNLDRLERLGVTGILGLYEAADFGGRPATRQPRVVRSFMAHHQGMILGAIGNFIGGAALVERFHRDSRIATFEYLLHEAAPGRVRVQPPPSRPRLLAPERRAAIPTVSTWSVDPDAFPPPTTVVSNGALSSLLTATGSGGLRWRGRDVLRWRPDPTAQTWGSWIYVRDVESNQRWSAALAPTWTEPRRYSALFGPHAVEFQREDSGIAMRTVVTTGTTSDIEIRHVTLVNESPRPRTLELTSYAEVALADPGEDRRHPAFSKLFVEGRYASRARALLLQRRIRGDEGAMYIAHAVVGTDPGAEPVSWELDRAEFLGRRGSPRSPAALSRPVSTKPGDKPWAPLDPIVSLTTRIDVPSGSEVSVVFLTSVAGAPGAALAILDAYRSPERAHFAISQARDHERSLLQELSLGPDLLPVCQRLLTAIVFPYHTLRAPDPKGAAAHQPTLWSLGVSGDLPVVVVETSGEREQLLDDLVRAQAYWEKHNVRFDLVAVGRAADGYSQPVRAHLSRLLSSLGAGDRLDRPGGVHHVSFGRMAEPALEALRAAASVFLVDDGRSLSEHLEQLEPRPPALPPFVPVGTTEVMTSEIDPLTRPADLSFDNGIGGFTSRDGEYLVHLEPGDSTPAPWSNVVAHEGFGFLVTESGGGFTWLENSGEQRLTPWRNDPITDVPGEVLYLRDEETGQVWSTTPSPAPAPAAYQVVHRPGSTTFHHRSLGLDQRLELLTPPNAAVKVVDLVLTNEWPRARRLTATYFAEWVLGVDRCSSGPHLSSRLSRADQAIFIRNRFSAHVEELTGFLSASRPIHQFTCDRYEFLGPEGDFSRPAGLVRIGLEGRTGSGLDPCTALQVHVDLAAGETQTVRFLLGGARSEEEARELLQRFRDPALAVDVRQQVDREWGDLVARVTVDTPEPAMDLMLNGWLLYQAVSCRLWGRSGYYQSSGAFGFRDQLQDSLALLAVAPHLTRHRILDAARHQFTEGDVLHWWHPETDRGVRTRCSDDLLWLPFAVAEYVEAVGDTQILDASVSFLDADPLEPDELERYEGYSSRGSASLYDHCMAALKRAGTRSDRGLPLIGSGDWNDALNRVGLEGRGESIWLAWFLYHVELRFARIAEARSDDAGVAFLRADAARLQGAVEAHGWDGAWYLRATFDDGSPVGSARSLECRIDSLTQSWAVISGGADPERARQAMHAVSERLIQRSDRLVLLLAPPFHATIPDPGYIRSYPRGVRENGGQYTHAATWVGFAYTAMEDGDSAEEVFRLLNPVLHSTDATAAHLYRVEPYVTAGDVYGVPPHTGRGGWTWYTGSAGWLYRLGMEGILGLRPAPGGLELRPCLPRQWAGFQASVRVGVDTVYRLTVRNPDRVCAGDVIVRLDGRELAGAYLPLEDDGCEHEADVIIKSRTRERS